ncbi:hypothetical protein EJA72_21165 [Pseudomonas sp. PB120]|nr:hypothetical protein [Pseudomonas sp. PB120]
MLAMVVNDNAGNLMPRDVLRFIASRLAPRGNQRISGLNTRRQTVAGSASAFRFHPASQSHNRQT